MFRGLHHLSLDDKYRLVLPARHRERLQEKCAGRMVVTVAPQLACLRLYPLPVWEELEPQIQALSSQHPQERSFKTLVLGYACDIDCDGNGRMLIPPPLREHAQLEKDKKAVLIGQGNKLELWDEGQWLAERDQCLQVVRAPEALSDAVLRLAL